MKVSNGAVTVNAIGGVGDYSYSWNTGDTTASILNLPNGEYAVTVTDGNGCETHFFDTVGVLGELFLPATIINVSCNGGADGVIDVTPLGATPPYAYQWSSDTTNQSAIWMLEVGTYSVTVSDAHGCVVIDTFSISEPDELQVSVDQVTPAIGNNADGAVAITVEGGTPGYSFQWLLNNNLMSEEEDPTGLPAGEYTLLLTDDHGCDTSLTIVIESVTSAEERNLLQQIQLTPNPTTGQFSLLLDLPNHKEVTAAIYDISGKIISAAIPVVDRHDFDLTNEAAGVYLLRIRVGEMEVAKRVVVID
ncbi:MAG: T9SS type A sorting domain-containing protein [Saprospiraceae bacterium]